MAFDIAIVGAGIAGLASAIALSRDGHRVTVYERRPGTEEESGAGVQLLPSAIKILKKWGLLDELAKVAHENGQVKMLRYSNSTTVMEQRRQGSRSQWFCLRPALRAFLYKAAITSGATVHFNTSVRSIDYKTPSILFDSGLRKQADLIIGADGSNSMVRRTIFPGSEREAIDWHTVQAQIPRQVMHEDPVTKAMYDDPSTRIYMGPGVWSLASAAPRQDVYDLQILIKDLQYDPAPDRWLHPLDNLDILGSHLDGWDPVFRNMLKKTRRHFKWHIVEIPRLESAVAPGSKVVLVGDASHGHDPHAGAGSSASLEDAVALAATLRNAHSIQDLPRKLEIYDKVQHERVNAVRSFSAMMGMIYTLPDSSWQRKRDASFQKFDFNSVPAGKVTAKAKFGTPEWQAYLDDYDGEGIVEEAIRDDNNERERSRLERSRL